MHELKEMLCEKLDQYADSGRITATTLGEIHTLTDTIKNLLKIEMLDEVKGYSNDYSNCYSTRRRDSRGRYARKAMSHRYSRDDAKDHMLGQIAQMIEDAPGEEEREALRRCMTVFEQ